MDPGHIMNVEFSKGVGLSGVGRIPSLLWLAGAGAFGAQAAGGALSIKVFDKKAARYESKDFGEAVQETKEANKMNEE